MSFVRQDKELADKRARATALVTFSDAFEDAGHPELARRSRLVARDALELVGLLEAERSARVAMQEARDRAIWLITNPDWLRRERAGATTSREESHR